MSVIPNPSDSSDPNQDDSTDEEFDEKNLPAPDSVPDEQTVLPNLTGVPTQRKYAFKITLPQDPKQRKQLPEDINGMLLWILTDVAEETCIDSVETLMFPSPEGLRIILHPRPSYLDGNRDTQTKLDTFGEKFHTTATSKLKSAIKNRVPPRVTVEFGHLDLEPIGTTDVTTSRLYGKHDGQQLNSGIAKQQPLEVLFSTLQKNHDPFLYQVIVEESSGNLNTVVRLATYHPKDNYTGDRGFAELATKGKPTDPARVFGKENVVSNHNIDKRYHDITYREFIDGSNKAHVSYRYRRGDQFTTKAELRRKADKIKEIVLGKKEHNWLMNGDTTGHPLYEDEFNRHKRLNLTPGQLLSFVRVVERKWETNPWLAVPGRSAPVFRKIDEVEIQTSAVSSPTPEIDIDSDDNADNKEVANQGASGHQDLEDWFLVIGKESGDVIFKVVQTTESLPDCRIESDDGRVHSINRDNQSPVVAVEIESRNKTKTSNTLKNAERAYAANRDVIFVYEEKDVETGYTHLARPYNDDYTDADDNKTGVILYNKTDCVTTTDGWTLVREGLDSLTYILRGAELTAVDGDEIIAQGDASDRLSTFDWECHCYKKVDGKYRIETLDGEFKTEYAAKQAFLADWTKVHEPHIPTALTYLDFSTVVYRDKETKAPKLWEPSPEWATSDKSKTWKAGIKRFVEDHIVTRDDEQELTYDELDAAFSQWFEAQCEYEAPPRSVIGQHLPDELSDAKTGASGNKYKYFDGYGLKMNPNLEPPNLQGPPADYDSNRSATDGDTETTDDSTTEAKDATQTATDDTTETTDTEASTENSADETTTDAPTAAAEDTSATTDTTTGDGAADKHDSNDEPSDDPEGDEAPEKSEDDHNADLTDFE